LGRAGIIGTGIYVPPRVLTNFDLEKMVDTSDEWIRTRTGIIERRIAEEGVASSDLGIEAAKAAIEDAGIDPKEIDLILTATITPDMAFPSTACWIQKALPTTRHLPAFDLSAACSGFVYGLEVGRAFINSGIYRTVLLVACETLSKITDWSDRSTCVLLADGAGAVVLGEVKEGYGIIGSRLAADGRAGELLWLPGGGSRNPSTHKTIDEGLHYIKMKGNELFKIGVYLSSKIGNQLLAAHNIAPEEVDLVIMHQANLRIMEAVAKRMRIPMDKVFVNIHKYGNTSAASCAIALDEASKGGRLKDGDLILFLTIGGGLTWSGSLVRWGGRR
jgi:3-oxoacyl-[acyl-carrier-protein] synthase-3